MSKNGYLFDEVAFKEFILELSKSGKHSNETLMSIEKDMRNSGFVSPYQNSRHFYSKGKWEQYDEYNELNPPWIFYFGDTSNNSNKYNRDKDGKWMYFFDDIKFASKICKNAIEQNIVNSVKHSSKLNKEGSGVCCFYLNIDDIEGHKKVITYFIENNLIKKTKDDRLYDISFKLNEQTRAGEYGSKFNSDVKLSKFINLYTGEWLL